MALDNEIKSKYSTNSTTSNGNNGNTHPTILSAINKTDNNNPSNIISSNEKLTTNNFMSCSREDITTSSIPGTSSIQNPPQIMSKENLDLSYYSESNFLQLEKNIDGLGPLPHKWEKAFTESGELYFIDHNTGTSHWLDPRLSKFQKKSLEDCMEDELPYGWEKIHDPQYGTYFIDHVNRRTQYENPVLEAKRKSERNNRHDLSSSKQTLPYTFTRNPQEMQGERITTTLLKSSRGLGITIVGGDDSIDEFLQIKSIVPNGPAWLDGKLQTGDILVHVNDTCVLGFTHHEMVNVFQSILAGETVTLEVCRGYPLPFDPNDPNTEVVTTIAVDGINSHPEKTRMIMELNMDGNYNFLDISGDSNGASGGPGGNIKQKNPLTKLQSVNNGSGGGGNEFSGENFASSSEDTYTFLKQPEILNISIVKGIMGFGFTIADSAYGQKVKKILDRNCCKNLQEGDILLEINKIIVNKMSHSEVVQVLKDCPKAQEADLKVQRGYYVSTTNGMTTNRASGGVAAVTGSKQRKNIQILKDDKHNINELYRSKTPTADLYSTQPKEILPIRPKTPIIDTRNQRSRAKTPSSELNDEKPNEIDSKLTNSTQELDEINNDIPFMDPYPKLVKKLTERLAETSMTTAVAAMDNNGSDNIYQQNSLINHPPNNHHHASYESDPNDPAASAYTMTPFNIDNNNHLFISTNSYPLHPLRSSSTIITPVPTYHQETCFCYECQDFQRHQNDYQLQIGQGSPHGNNLQATAAASYHNNKILSQQNDDHMEKQRLNEFMIENSLENHLQLCPPPQPPSMWRHPLFSNSTNLNQSIAEDEYTLSEVTLERQALGFGFRIVGGTEEGSQVTVGHIVPGGSADGDIRITTGDEILSIDGINVVNASHHKVVLLMGEAALRGHVTMILRRRKGHSTTPTTTNFQTIQYPYDVIVNRNENEGFGFVIISSKNQYYGSTIGKLIPGSPADVCGELKVGDRIIAVNRIDIAGMSHGDVVNLIKDSGLHVRLTIGYPKDSAAQQITHSQSSSIVGISQPRRTFFGGSSQIQQTPSQL